MANGGKLAQRGFIFQSIIAMIECLDRSDWDAIKVEPETVNDKVDIMFYRNGRILSAIQVKSSINPFRERDVETWLKKLKEDAGTAEEICLYLVGEFTCEDFIKCNPEIKIVSFQNLDAICTGKLAAYVRKADLDEDVTVRTLDLIDDSLFAKIHKNSIAEGPMSRDEFEAAFRRAIPHKNKSYRQDLPPIKEKALAPCEPFIEGNRRSEDITNIGALIMQTNKPIWIYGESGIGKTELIRRFAELHSEYEYVFVTYMGSVNQTISKNLFILTKYEASGTELSDVVRYEQNYAAFELYSRQLRTEGRNLILVIDHYDSYDYEKDACNEVGLPLRTGFSGEKNDSVEIEKLQKIGIKILLTACKKPQDTDIYASYEVKVMDEDDCFSVMTGCFTRIVPYIEKQDVRQQLLYLIWAAGKNTVYITIMAFAMQISPLKPEQSLDKMVNTFDFDDLYRIRYSLDKMNMHGHIEKTLGFVGLSYEEQQLLGSLTLLPIQGMQLTLFWKLMALNAVQLEKTRRVALQKFIDTNIVIEDHQEDSELEEDGRKTIRMIQLVADHVQRELISKNKIVFLNSLKMNWVTRLLHYIDEHTLENLKRDDAVYPYVSPLAEACSAAEQKLKKIGEQFQCEEEVAVSRRELLTKASELSEKVGNVKDALEYAERAIAVEGPYAEDMDSLVYRMNSVGLLFLSGGKYNRAKNFFNNCLKILNDKNGIIPKEDVKSFDSYDIEEIIQTYDSATYAILFNNMGNVYEDQGDYGNALEYYGKALAIRKIVFGTDHPDTATTYNNMAVVFRAQGDYGKALEYYGKAFTICERVLGTDHPDMASTYNNIAGVYSAQGYYRKALEYYVKALAICERVLGTNHPDTAITYNNIAGVYEEQANYGMALEYYGKALAIRERVLGTDHPSTATTYNNIAGVYDAQGDYGKSLEYYGKALTINERVIGLDHPSTATTYNNMAGVYDAQGDYGKALEYYGKALAISERVLGTDHPSTATMYNNIAGVFRAQGDYGKALEYYGKALAISERVLGLDHPNMARTYNSMAWVYRDQGDFKTALCYYKKAYDIRLKKLGDNHPDTKCVKRSIEKMESKLK